MPNRSRAKYRASILEPLFIDDSASAYLHLLYQNNERAPHIDGLALAYAHTRVLEVPDRPHSARGTASPAQGLP